MIENAGRVCPGKDHTAPTEKGCIGISDELRSGTQPGYIYHIYFGKALPPLKEFFAICDYFEISPAEFFSAKTANPKLSRTVTELLEQLDQEDLELTLTNIQRLLRK